MPPSHPSLRFGGFLLAALASSGAAAQTYRGVEVRVAPGACPDADAVREQLAPLLPGQPASVVESDRLTPERDLALVRNQGDHYAVEMEGGQRQWSDTSGDCEERARVVAVFIALNLERARQAAEVVEASGADGATRAGLWAFGRVAHATGPGLTTAGGGAGAWLELAPLQLGFDLRLVAPVRVELDPVGTTQGAVELSRVGLDAMIAYLWNAGDARLGPFASFGADLLSLEGVDVVRPRQELRLDPGLGAGARLSLPLGAALTAVLRVWLRVHPRAYDLALDPAGRLGHTPRLWLGADLGLGYRL